MSQQPSTPNPKQVWIKAASLLLFGTCKRIPPQNQLVQSSGYDRCGVVSRLDHQSLAWCQFNDLIMGMLASLWYSSLVVAHIFCLWSSGDLTSTTSLLSWANNPGPPIPSESLNHVPNISKAADIEILLLSEEIAIMTTFCSLSFKSLYHCVVNSIFWTWPQCSTPAPWLNWLVNYNWLMIIVWIANAYTGICRL